MPFLLTPPHGFLVWPLFSFHPALSVSSWWPQTKNTRKKTYIFLQASNVFKFFDLRPAKDLAWPTTNCKSVDVCITGSQDPQVQRCVTYSTRQKVRFSVILLHAARSWCSFSNRYEIDVIFHVLLKNDYHDNCRAQWEVQAVTHCPGWGGSKSWYQWPLDTRWSHVFINSDRRICKAHLAKDPRTTSTTESETGKNPYKHWIVPK